MKRECDIAIVGGGMVGNAAAALLAASLPDLAVTVIDAQRPPAWEPGAEVGLRVSALSLASRHVLEGCGAWSTVAAGRISPYTQMRVWDAGVDANGPAALRLCATDVGARELGHIVENELVRYALREALARRTNVQLLDEAQVAGLELGDEHAELRLEDTRRLRARLVIGADGAGSRTRELAGLEVKGHDYDQKAVVGHLRPERSHRRAAWQRFLPDGPIALLPLADGRVSMVWSTDPGHAGALLALDEESFMQAVAEASAGVLGRMTECGPRGAFPLRMRYAPVYTRPRFALAGDAAHAVHPLAGQGVNLGFLDAAALAEVVSAGVREGRDPGDHALLRRYERWRKGENLMAMAAFDGLNRLFSNDSAVLGALRRAGFSVVDRIGPVKAMFIRRAMGADGDLPAAARPA
jgi:2-octaprenylphenol hydroxylase